MFDFLKKFKKDKNENFNLVSIGDGKIIDVNTISDEIFSKQMLGKTCAFHFEGSCVEICSPADGVLSVVFETGHAFGITTDQGIELLLHVGVDTVNEQGKGFTTKVHQGDKIKQGDVLVVVDFEYLAAKYDTSTMLILTSSDKNDIKFINPGKVRKGQSIILDN